MSIEPAVMDADPSTNSNPPDPGKKVVTNGSPLVAYYTEARLTTMAS